MRRSDLILFKDKYGASDFFVSVADSLIAKLIDYGYITKSQSYDFVERMFNNVTDLVIGSKNKYDYKSGYYDANKKVLYIQDEKNIPSVYLRLLYALTTKEIDDNIYLSGFSTTKLRSDNYKLEHINYGINRAIMANLVCKLCELVPADFQIVPVEKTYTHNFLGYEIESANNIYALEGKILAEMCYILSIDPEILYASLFSKDPIKELTNILNKKGFKRYKDFLKLFDSISRKYNLYNKLAFLSQKLNENYLEYKKHILKDDTGKIKVEKKIIETQIANVLSSIFNYRNKSVKDNYDEEDEIESTDLTLTSSLAEALENLEQDLKDSLISLQDILAEQLISSSKNLVTYKYASKLKLFNDILIVPSKKINEEIQNTILNKLMPKTEVTGINLIQKIKYAIIEDVLSKEDYSSISKTFSFYNINNFIDEENGTTLVILGADKRFSRLLEIKGLNNSLSDFTFELNYLPLDNLKHLMNNSYSNIHIQNPELLFTSVRNDFNEFSNLSMDNIFVFEYNNKNYLTIYHNGNVNIISYKYVNKEYTFTLLDLSEQYSVFGETKISNNIFISNLPMLYKK